MNQTYILGKSVEQNPDDMDSASCELQKWRKTKISYRKLWRQNKDSTYKQRKGEPEFLNYGTHPFGGWWLALMLNWFMVGVDVVVGWCAPKVSTWCEAGQERTGWLIAGNQMNLANTIPLPWILELDNPVTELLDICWCVVTQNQPKARFGQN